MTFLEMAHCLLSFQNLASRWYLGEDQPGNPRTPAGSFEEKSSAQRGHIVDSQSIKTTAVGGEERGYDGGKKVKVRKRHILVDTEGFVLKVKVHSAKIMDSEGIKTLLERAGELFPRLSHLWLDGGYRGEDKGKDWVQKYLEWSVELVERPRKPAREEVLIAWAAEWAKEGVTIDWRKLMPPGGFQVLPRRWVVERSFAWICHNRQMSKDYERLFFSIHIEQLSHG